MRPLYLILAFFAAVSCQTKEQKLTLVDKSKYFLEKSIANVSTANNNFDVGVNGKDSEVYHFRRSDTTLTTYNLSKNQTKKIHLRNIVKLSCSDKRITNCSLYAQFLSSRKWIALGTIDIETPATVGITYSDLEGNPVLSVYSDSNETKTGYPPTFLYHIQCNDLYDSSILLAMIPSGHPVEMQYKISPLMMYHLGTRKLEESFVKYPNNYFVDGKYLFHLGSLNLTVVEDFLVVSFKYSDSLFLYKNKRLYKKILAKSRYIEKFEYQILDSVKSSFSYIMDYLTRTPCYTSIQHDPYRKKIYRLARHAQPLFNSDKTANKYEDANLSIVIFDSEFNYEGEVMVGSGHSERFLGCLPEGIVMVKMRDGKNKSSIIIKELKIE
jgi:hypothetical protein